MKKFIIITIVAGLIAVGAGYFGASLFSKDNPEMASNNQEEIELKEKQTKEQIENLVKTYLVSSFNNDWDVVKTISAGEYLERLEDTDFSEYEEEFEFNPRSTTVSFNSLSETQAVAEVSYSVKVDDIPFQEDVVIYFSKEKGLWKIISIEEKS